MERKRVLLTDHPWPDVAIEEGIFRAAGLDLVAGPTAAPPVAAVENVVARVDPAAIMTCWAEVSENAIRAPSNLVIVSRLGIGLDNIAVAAATARGAWVSNVPDYCVGEVADHAVGMLLTLTRGIAGFDRATKTGIWNPSGGSPLRTSDLTIGIVGFGQIGRATASRLAPFGCRILANSRSLRDGGPGVEAVDIRTLRMESDVIILHAPLTRQTQHLVDRAFIEECVRRPFLINVSRGGLVDNDALLEALNSGRFRGAAVDVLEGEPAPPIDLLAHPKLIATPHVAFLSEASLLELRQRACEDVVRAIGGDKPRHACNLPGLKLTGGVASDVRIVDGSHGKEVVKRALAQLRVDADWFADPGRSATETAALRVGRDLLGAEAVPEVLWEDVAANTFAMEYVPAPFTSWKERLISGCNDVVVADRAGELLAALHKRSAHDSSLRQRFDDLRNFRELRLEPFFERTAAAIPELASEIERAAAGMGNRRFALVHGDFSPKNLMTDGKEVVVIDWEVAHWGDPRFDVAFCLAHLILKGRRRSADRAAVTELGSSFAQAYRLGHPGIWDADLGMLTGALLVTRIVGPSPVDYRSELDGDDVLQLGADLLRSSRPSADLPFFANLEAIDAN